MITTNQMELGLEAQQLSSSASERRHRETRANWWFRQMRHVVDLAMEWRPKPPGRPQQSYMVLNVR
jgi:hypothetical protein